MNITISQPEYVLDRQALTRDELFIKHQVFNRAIRRRVPFFMDGYRYAAAAVKERWGIEFSFFEAGHDQVKPCYMPVSLNKEGSDIWWKKMNEDKAFAPALVREVRDVVDMEKKLAASIPQRAHTSEEIQQYLMAHLEWWVKFFEVAYLWFGVDNIKEKIDLQIADQWKDGEDALQRFLEEVYRPMQFPLSSIEQRDLLKLHILRGDELETALAAHAATYRHLSLTDIDDEFFDLEYYRGRLKALEDEEEFAKAKAMLDSADNEAELATEVIKEANLPPDLKEKVNFVRWFMYVRTETVDHFMLVNGAFKAVFASLSGIFSLPMDAVLHMTYEEILTSLQKGTLSVPKELVEERLKRGYAYLVSTPPHSSFFVTGKDADELNAFVIPEQIKEQVKELKGQIAFKGKVQGSVRVILDRHKAHELKEGEILVTTMTSPEFVPAMKMSGGIVTNEGGILCHAAIMSRELRKPCIIGTKIATDALHDGDLVEVDADAGVVRILR